jgi:CMP-N,N'-diacetyllegionaminic acid synthase
MSAARPRAIALIPARAGSKRVADKNVRLLGGHPMLAYSISAALDSGVFDTVMVSTDSEAYARMARHYGAEVPFLRPAEFSGDLSPDIEWITHLLRTLAEQGHSWDLFSILRPTSPLRQPETIRRAHGQFVAEVGADSLRAVEKCKQHPGKMWVVRGRRLLPLLPFGPVAQPWHSTPYQALPEIYTQNASLEMAWTRVVMETHTIAGTTIVPFLTEGHEGFDVNDPENWLVLERLVAGGDVKLPRVSRPPFV